jgi:hypothetical protein
MDHKRLPGMLAVPDQKDCTLLSAKAGIKREANIKPRF